MARNHAVRLIVGGESSHMTDEQEAPRVRWGKRMTDAPFPPANEVTPRLTGLVNIEIPYEQDFKHHHSNWDRYERRDFNSRIGIIERLEAAHRMSRFDPLVLTFLLSFACFVTVIWSYPRLGLSGPWFVITGICAVLIIWTMLWAQGKITDAHYALLLGPLRVLDLVGTPLQIVKDRSWFFWKRIFVEFRELSPARVVWLGSGQIQFGCGPKGICVEHHGGFLYVLGWERVHTIYFNDDLTRNPYPREDPRHAKVRKSLSGISVTRWAPATLRVRLSRTIDSNRPSAALEPPDEIIIPRRFFGRGPSDTTAVAFYEQCWEYRLAAEHADRRGGAAVTVLPQHASDTMVREAVEEQAEGVVEPRPQHANKRAAPGRSRGT